MNEIQFGLNGIKNNGNIVNDFMNTVYHIRIVQYGKWI